MPKGHLNYTTPLNLLVTPEMKSTISAVRFYRGSRSVGETTKDLISDALSRWIGALAPADRRRFDEILANVKIAEAYRGHPE